MKERGLSGSTLKLIAVISMLIDHTGAVLLTGSPYYSLCRTLGRLAFPIFCFLLVEGYVHTHDVKKYASRLAVFALLSEIPFDLAISGNMFNPYYQNVFFTLVLGLATLYGMDRAADAQGRVIAVLAGMAAAALLRTDYSWKGVLAVAVLYQTRENRLWQSIAGALMFCWEPPAMAAFVPLYFYNGKRGIPLKYLFYLFYPGHLLVLVLIKALLKTA